MPNRLSKQAKITSVSFAKTIAILRPSNAGSGYVSGCLNKTQPCEPSFELNLRGFAKC
jgi:hypothetical protein